MTLDEICQSYYTPIYRRCLHALYYNQALAEDVTQDVFHALCMQWNDLQHTNIKSWLNITADHMILKAKAKHTRQKNIVALDETYMESLVEQFSIEDQMLIEKINLDLDLYCDQIYAGLKEKEVQLAEYLRRKVKYAEIARLTGSTEGAVTMAVVRLHRKVEAMVRELTERL